MNAARIVVSLGLIAAFCGHALAQQEKGDLQTGKERLQAVLKQKEAEGKSANLEAAEAARHFSALAIFNSPWEALYASRFAVKLDPDNADGWKQLGNVLTRLGELEEANIAYEKAKSITTRESKKEKP